MAKCPHCGKDLHEVRGGYRCTNPDCFIFREYKQPKSLDDLIEAKETYEAEKRKGERKEILKGYSSTRVLCPECMSAYLKTDGKKYYCSSCNTAYESMDDVERREERKKAGLGDQYETAAEMAGEHRGRQYRIERDELRQKYARKRWYHLPFWARHGYREEVTSAKKKHLGKLKSEMWTEAMKSNISASNVVIAFVLIVAGVAAAALMGNQWFLWGFISLAALFLFPQPQEYKGPPVSWGSINPAVKATWATTHQGFAFLRSMAKIATIICFAMAFHRVGDVFNIPFILVCFGGYFFLKIRYNPKVPGEFLESLLRFGVLGAFFIPFILFNGIFHNYVLVVIAFAFFAIPPQPEGDEKNVAILAYWDMFDKIIFFVLMAVALIGSGALSAIGISLGIFGSGWGLTGTMASTFLYFWVISLIGGLFSPPETRPVTGFVMLFGATVIWGLIPGNQELGGILFGQWWPTLNNMFMGIAQPLTDVFGSLGNTFGNAFLMITNPVAYAHQIMEGNYGKTTGTDKVGSFGVEISNFKLGAGINDIYVEQPFQLSFTIKNEGGFDAENVITSLSTDLTYMKEKETTLGKTFGPAAREKVYIDEIISTSKDNFPQNLKCLDHTGDDKCKEAAFVVNPDGPDDEKTKIAKFDKQDMWPFVTAGTLGCKVVKDMSLREKSIPLIVKTTYKYDVSSTFQMEFLSSNEWSRMAKDGTLNMRSVASTVSTAPVKLSIAAMEQPIKAGTGFFVGVQLKSMYEGKGKILPPVNVVIMLPEEFKKSSCHAASHGGAKIENNRIIWDIQLKEEYKDGFEEATVYCDFYPKEADLLPGDEPSKTYVLDGSANYRFSKSERMNAKVAFGSWCCEDKDCEKLGKVCKIAQGKTHGTCAEKGS